MIKTKKLLIILSLILCVFTLKAKRVEHFLQMYIRNQNKSYQTSTISTCTTFTINTFAGGPSFAAGFSTEDTAFYVNADSTDTTLMFWSNDSFFIKTNGDSVYIPQLYNSGGGGTTYYAGNGLVSSSDTFSINLKSNQGLIIANDSLYVDYNNITIGIVSNKLGVKAQSITKTYIDTTSGFTFLNAFKCTSAVADSEYITKKYFTDNNTDSSDVAGWNFSSFGTCIDWGELCAATQDSVQNRTDSSDIVDWNFSTFGTCIDWGELCYGVQDSIPDSSDVAGWGFVAGTFVTQTDFDKVTDDTTGWNTTEAKVDGSTTQWVTGAMIDSTNNKIVMSSAYKKTSAVADSQYVTKKYVDNGGGTAYHPGLGLVATNDSFHINLKANQGLVLANDSLYVDYNNTTIGIVSNKLGVKAQSITKTQLDTTANYPFANAYHVTSAVADSQFISKYYVDNIFTLKTDFTKVADDTTGWNTTEAKVDGSTTQWVTGAMIDSTSNKIVISSAYKNTSAISDSQFITKKYVDGTFTLKTNFAKIADDTIKYHAAADTAHIAWTWGNHASVGYLDDDGTDPLTGDWNVGAFEIRTSTHFDVDGYDGVYDTVRVITNVQFNGSAIQVKYLYKIFRGGILVTVSAESGWTNTPLN